MSIYEKQFLRDFIWLGIEILWICRNIAVFHLGWLIAWSVMFCLRLYTTIRHQVQLRRLPTEESKEE